MEKIINSEPNPKDNVHEDEEMESEEVLQYMEVMNVFVEYYKRLYNKPSDYNIFQDIDENDVSSTNRAMELFYQELKTYNEKPEDDTTVYDPEDVSLNSFTSMFSLTIDNKNKAVSPTLMSLVVYLSKMPNWNKSNWQIIQVKGDS